MKRKLIHFVSKLIHESGIEILQKNGTRDYDKSWRFFAILITYMTAGTSTFIQSLLKEKGVHKFINPIPYVALGCVMTSHSLILFFNKKILSEMLYRIDRNVYTYPDPDENLSPVTYKWYLREENILIALKVILFWQLANLWGLFMPALIELYRYNKIETFIYPGWTPWKVESLHWQIITCLWQFFPTLCGIWLNQIVIMMVSVVLSEFLRQYERLEKAVVSLKERTVVDSGGRVDGEGMKIGRIYDQEIRKNIIHCIKHQQELRQNFHLFEIWFSVMFSFELAIATMTLALGIYAMINASKLSTLLHYTIVVAYMMVNLLVKCLIGEVFVELNKSVAYALFSEFEWFELSKGTRQVIVLFHHMMCRPFHLYGFQIFGVTRALYGGIIRITYSVFNVLNISLNK